MESFRPSRPWGPNAASSCVRTRRERHPVLPPRLEPGDRLGRCRLVREIASGGSSSVYEAIDERNGRCVALKVLSSHLAVVPNAVSRFRTEAALAERVRHPSLITILGSGFEAGYSFYLMRLEREHTAADRVPNAPLPRDEEYYVDLAARFASLAGAVQLLHSEGIVHRDVKPSNILLDADGRFVLADFGSALDRHSREPAFERWLEGTVLYMSPEQVTGAGDPYDPSGDLYGLGASLYELSAGAPPFPVLDDEELARWKLTRIPPPPRRVNPYLPLGLDAVVRQAMDPHRSLRYDAAGDLARDLHRFASRRMGPARRR